MGQLLVRELEQSIIDALKRRAAEHGRSAEAEHRAILKQALLQPNRRSFIEVLMDIPEVGNDSDFIRVQESRFNTLTVVTRNIKHFVRTGVPVLNPFEG